MWSSNVFWALLFILSEHYAAGGLLEPGEKIIQKTYTDEREDLQEKTTEVKNDVYGLLCKKDEKYRSIDGTCNNMCNNEKTSHLGAAGTDYTRYMENSYCDGIEELPCTGSNDSLPSARAMSMKLYNEKKKQDHNNTVLSIGFGQFIVHDVAFFKIGTLIRCCENGKYTSYQKTHPKCDAIAVPKDDPIFGPAGIECLNLVRSDTSDHKPAVPSNGVTAFLDGSPIYGSDDVTMKSLRTLKGGKLQSKEENDKEWLPQNLNPLEACFNLASPEEPCYRAGDARVNQNTILTFIHTIFLRLHNYIARKLCGNKRCSWNDEKCFQEARRIVIAILQNICYEEYLPSIIGRKYMYKHKLLYKKSCRDENGYVDDYSCDCDPSMSVECATAALRRQHSAIPGLFKLYFETEDSKNKSRCDDDYFNVTGSIELSAWMNKPAVIEIDDNSIGLSHCLFAQRQQAVDPNFSGEIFHRLFRADKSVGTDLVAIDIERARDHGLVTYCNAALACGVLKKCNSFDDIRKYIPDKHVSMLKKIYADVQKVELMVGGMLERNECGARTGPVFQCIMGKQFLNTRCGDSFWYERGDQIYPLTPDQLRNIRKITMASIICQHGDGVDKIQKQAFKKISKKNPLKHCSDLPTLDFSLFKCYDKK